MSDNPLADWLRERGAWSGDGEHEAAGPSSVLGDVPPSSPGDAHGRPAAGPPGAGGHGRPPGEDPTAPLDLGPDWVDDPRPRPDCPRRMLLLLGLAAVPWLGFAAVALGALGGPAGSGGDAAVAPDGSTAPAPRGEPSGPTGRDVPPERDVTPGSPLSGPPAPTRMGEAQDRENADRRAGAAAALAVRTDVTGDIPGDGGGVRYVDLAVVEAIGWFGDVAIVEVAAVVLDSAGDTWGEPRRARFAVPVRVTGSEAVPIARAWSVAPPASEEKPAWEPVADTDLAAAAAAALGDGGYEDVADVTVARSGDVPGILVAEVVAIGPGERAAATHRVWLRDGDPPSLFTTDLTTREEPEP